MSESSSSKKIESVEWEDSKDFLIDMDNDNMPSAIESEEDRTSERNSTTDQYFGMKPKGNHLEIA